MDVDVDVDDVDVDVHCVCLDGTCASGRYGTGWDGILVAKTSKEVNLKQNLTHELMVTSVWPCVVRNLAKFAKIKNFSIRKLRKKKRSEFLLLYLFARRKNSVLRFFL